VKKFISKKKKPVQVRDLSLNKIPKKKSSEILKEGLDQEQRPFCTGSQQMNQPNNKKSNGLIPELLLVKKKFLGKMENLSSMHSINQSEQGLDFSIKNNYFQDETKLTIFSEEQLNKAPKILTYREPGPGSNANAKINFRNQEIFKWI
jgi:hypothetical protein